MTKDFMEYSADALAGLRAEGGQPSISVLDAEETAKASPLIVVPSSLTARSIGYPAQKGLSHGPQQLSIPPSCVWGFTLSI